MTKKIKKDNSYTAKDIYVLQGLEPVRRRPGMYIGSTGIEGFHRLVYEVVANAVDEAIMGYCTEISIKILPGERIEVKDNGRGIPVDIHPQTKKSALETVMTTLHAGAKFGGKAYASTGGLHGVGVSAVCALSELMEVEVCRDNKIYFQKYSKGKPISKLKTIGKCNLTGTKITFKPDTDIFGKNLKFKLKKILNYLRQQAYLNKGLKIRIVDERTKPNFIYNFYFEGGIVSYVRYLLGENKPFHQNIFYVQGEKEGILVEVAFQYSQEIEAQEESFVNNIYTEGGGSHLTGFRTALTRVLNDYAKKEKLIKENFSGEDVREGLIAVVSVKIKEPQFEGQTKQKLGNPEAKTAVDQVVSEGLSNFLERYPDDAKLILQKCLVSQKARQAAKIAKTTVLRKGALVGLTLPGKLTDCISRKPEESELFIVEGESAGGSSRQARDRRFQAILPLRGKILNVEKARLVKILSSEEIKAIITSLGTGIGEDFNLNKLRYHKIIIMSDSDVDGAHIRTLLLTLFFRYFKDIIKSGFLYVAQPPLYKIQVKNQTSYFYTEEQKDNFLKKLKTKDKISIQRYKGLGEMNANELWETTMDPNKRVLKQITIEDGYQADRLFDTLMGKEVLPRKKFIQLYAKQVRNLDI